MKNIAHRRINLVYHFSILLIIGLILSTSVTPGSAEVIPPLATDVVQGPMTRKSYIPAVLLAGHPIMLGVYTISYLGTPSTIQNEVKAIDTWSGKRNSIVGTFIGFEDPSPDFNVPVPLGYIWDNGYTPFVNLGTNKTLDYINSGQNDTQIRAIANAFKTWRDTGSAKGQNRKAFAAPFQEMNGNWVTYHDNDVNKFKTAFQRVKSIFNQAGASSAVRWVFAPNGWSDPSDPPFESYYPGDSEVEAVAFSSYNQGYCPSNAWKQWDNPQTVFQSYVQRMRAMAPSKGIIIAQTASTAYTPSGYDEAAKGDWIHAAYDLLASSQGVIGIIYFNIEGSGGCDWAFYLASGKKIAGYQQAVANSKFGYITPENLAKGNITP